MSNSKTIFDDKDIIGRVICAVPTGNNRTRRGTNNNIVEIDELSYFRVIKVYRKYVDLEPVSEDGAPLHSRHDGLPYVLKLCKVSGANEKSVQKGYGLNAGYKFYLDVELLKKSILADKLYDEVKTRFFSGFNRSLDDDKVFSVAELLNVSLNENKEGV